MTTIIAPNTEVTEVTEATIAIVPEVLLSRSVVRNTYKAKYANRVLDGARGKKGVSKKARARSCADWLALELAAATLVAKDKLDVAAFEAILDANGIAHSHWNRTTKGWQGRLRMTGRLALQRAVAAEEALYLADGTTKIPPRSWIAVHQH